MTTLVTFAVPQPVHQTLTYLAFRCRCPFTEADDTAAVTLTYWATTEAVELGSLAAYLARWATVAITHEAVAVQIAADVSAAVGVPVRVALAFAPTEGIAATVVAGEA